jgi:peptidoglycan/xylan/chitin deacetylase (PgdA/CDA1 family)
MRRAVDLTVKQATFFITGVNRGKGHIEDPGTGYPATIMRMHSEGHQIGSHSWSHEDLRNVSSQGRQDQIVKLETALVSILGFFPTYLRPPFTKWNDDVLADIQKFGYHNVCARKPVSRTARVLACLASCHSLTDLNFFVLGEL